MNDSADVKEEKQTKSVATISQEAEIKSLKAETESLKSELEILSLKDQAMHLENESLKLENKNLRKENTLLRRTSSLLNSKIEKISQNKAFHGQNIEPEMSSNPVSVTREGKSEPETELLEHRVGFPEHRDGLPGRQLKLPEQRNELPEHHLEDGKHLFEDGEHRDGFPEHQVEFPEHLPELPEHLPELPEHRPELPEHRPEFPEHQVAPPEQRVEDPGQHFEPQERGIETHEGQTEPSEAQDVPYGTKQIGARKDTALKELSSQPQTLKNDTQKQKILRSVNGKTELLIGTVLVVDGKVQGRTWGNYYRRGARRRVRLTLSKLLNTENIKDVYSDKNKLYALAIYKLVTDNFRQKNKLWTIEHRVNMTRLLLYILKHNNFTKQESMKEAGISKSTFGRDIKALKLKGWIRASISIDEKYYYLTVEGKKCLESAKDMIPSD